MRIRSYRAQLPSIQTIAALLPDLGLGMTVAACEFSPIASATQVPLLRKGAIQSDSTKLDAEQNSLKSFGGATLGRTY